MDNNNSLECCICASLLENEDHIILEQCGHHMCNHCAYNLIENDNKCYKDQMIINSVQITSKCNEIFKNIPFIDFLENLKLRQIRKVVKSDIKRSKLIFAKIIEIEQVITVALSHMEKLLSIKQQVCFDHSQKAFKGIVGKLLKMLHKVISTPFSQQMGAEIIEKYPDKINYFQKVILISQGLSGVLKNFIEQIEPNLRFSCVVLNSNITADYLKDLHQSLLTSFQSYLKIKEIIQIVLLDIHELKIDVSEFFINSFKNCIVCGVESVDQNYHYFENCSHNLCLDCMNKCLSSSMVCPFLQCRSANNCGYVLLRSNKEISEASKNAQSSYSMKINHFFHTVRDTLPTKEVVPKKPMPQCHDKEDDKTAPNNICSGCRCNCNLLKGSVRLMNTDNRRIVQKMRLKLSQKKISSPKPQSTVPASKTMSLEEINELAKYINGDTNVKPPKKCKKKNKKSYNKEEEKSESCSLLSSDNLVECDDIFPAAYDEDPDDVVEDFKLFCQNLPLANSDRKKLSFSADVLSEEIALYERSKENVKIIE